MKKIVKMKELKVGDMVRHHKWDKEYEVVYVGMVKSSTDIIQNGKRVGTQDEEEMGIKLLSTSGSKIVYYERSDFDWEVKISKEEKNKIKEQENLRNFRKIVL
jgi:hypothetical protein